MNKTKDKSQNVDSILNRVKEAYDKETDAELANFFGVKPNTVSAWRSRNSIDYGLLFTKCEDIDNNWLIYGKGEPRTNLDKEKDDTIRFKEMGNVKKAEHRYSVKNDSEFYTIPFYASVKASAGGGLIPQEKDPLEIAFRKYFVNSTLHAQATDLFAMMIHGDSMAPTLADEDLVLIDRSKRTARTGNILVIRIDETISCKRIQELPGNRFRVMSDNQAYESFEVSTDEEGFEIIGTVIWYGRTL